MSLKDQIAIVTQLQRHVDDRGLLDQIYNSDLPMEVKRIYTVFSPKGIIRAFHKNIGEYKYFYMLKGTARFVAVDKEKDILTQFVLTDRKAELLIVNPDVWNGWQALSDASVLGLATTTMKEHKDERCDAMAFGNEIWRVKPR